MVKDYVRETPEYVRGTLVDSIHRCMTWCQLCGEDVNVVRDGCHVYCNTCGAASEGCGD